MAAADPRIRQIKIKTGVLKRNEKEMKMYQKEATAEEAKLEKMKAEAGDEYVIKKQGEILAESRMMIPDCRKRVIAAHADLTNLLAAEEEMKEAEEYKTAQALLIEIKLDELGQ
ncbi:tubulin-specific chaperone A-like [Amphiura filiformis]|uniref:tubulin-specific chaperone A-like n=1 Tax=Amphiura filiformis TaxID=82378 RepID=UPI003B20E362